MGRATPGKLNIACEIYICKLAMPNWCENSLFVYGSTQDLARFAAAGVRPEECEDENREGIVEIQEMWRMSRYLPIPADFDDPSQSDDALQARHGACTARQWCLSNWGVKWDSSSRNFGRNNVDGSFYVYFDTAWSPPVAWLDRVQASFPTLRFRMQYMEENEWFAGIAYTERNGEIVDESDAPAVIHYRVDDDNEWVRANEDDDYDSDDDEVENPFEGRFMWWEAEE